MKSYYIVAYTFRAEMACPNCVRNWGRDRLREHGYTEKDIKYIESAALDYGAGFAARESENILHKLSFLMGINLDDYYSFDSDNFPKVVFADQVEEDEYCGVCLEKIL